jgi:hypothetical protein
MRAYLAFLGRDVVISFSTATSVLHVCHSSVVVRAGLGWYG